METAAGQIRLWIYRSVPKLTPEQENHIRKLGTAFIDQWAAHGAKLNASFKVLNHHFLVFFVNEDSAQASGCSIDASVSLIRQIEGTYKLGLLDRLQVPFLENDEVVMHHFSDLKELYAKGIISDESRVFNLLLEEGSSFDSEWLVPFSQSPYYKAV